MLKTRTANPGSVGGYTGKKVEYDIIGRAYRETVPTEIDASWEPDGDDDRGSGVWLWNTTEFDWKGRPSRTIPSDSDGIDGRDTLYTYEGCGCAGGQITTIKGPVTTAIDVAGITQTTKRRTQKIHADILGRTAKTELWDLDGAGGTPYSTVKNTYNGRDQVTLIEEFVGGTGGTHQDTTMSYDGHGRPDQVHKPEWFESSTLKYQTTTYNPDDTVATVTDPRGAVTSYTYGLPSSSEKRAVVTNIAYSVPSGSNIPDPTDIAFTYDNAGNRTFMSDGTGELTYAYDELSRLKTETKDFTDSLADAPDGVYTLTYNYHLTGGIKSITDPFGDEVNYTPDSIGRTTTIGGSEFAGFTTYASNISYRAFGNVKSMSYNTTDATSITMDYDTALRPTAYRATSAANAGDIHDKAYQYYGDGSVWKTKNNDDGKFTQTNEYDFAGRLKKNTFGEIGTTSPYQQTLKYDERSNIIERKTWDKNSTERSFTAGYTNNRKSSGGYGSGTDTFDAAGNITQNHFYDGANNDRTWKLDAAGRMTDWLESLPYLAPGHYWDAGEAVTFDGDGRSAKRVKRSRYRTSSSSGYVFEYEYKIISSVTGQTITELTQTGKKLKTNIYMAGSVIASQNEWNEAQSVFFTNTDPLTGSTQITPETGEILAFDTGRTEFEPFGAVANPLDEEMTVPNYGKGGSIKNPQFGGCVVDGIMQSRNVCSELLGMGLASICPDNDCSPKRVYYNGKNVWAFVQAYGDGYSGFVPQNARYIGNGVIEQRGKSVKGKIRRKDTNIGGINGADNESDLSNQTSVTAVDDPPGYEIHYAFSKFVLMLKNNKITDDCKKNVLDKLGLKADDLYKYLIKGSSFSFNSSDGGETNNEQSKLKLTVAWGSGRVNSSNNGINADNLADVFHESLHGYGAFIASRKGYKGLALGGVDSNFTDVGLFQAFDIEYDSDSAIYTGTTAPISEYIKKHCF